MFFSHQKMIFTDDFHYYFPINHRTKCNDLRIIEQLHRHFFNGNSFI